MNALADVRAIDFSQVDGIIFDALHTTLEVRRPAEQTFHHWAELNDLDPEAAWAAARRLELDCSRGQIPVDDWIAQIAAAGADGQLPAWRIQRLLTRLQRRRRLDLHPYPGVHDLLRRQLDSSRATAVLGDLSHLSCRAVRHLLRPVTAMLCSCETGLHKGTNPATAIIDACKHMGVEPSRCLFVDDELDFCRAAHILGLQVVAVGQTDAQAVADLVHLGLGSVPTITQLVPHL